MIAVLLILGMWSAQLDEQVCVCDFCRKSSLPELNIISNLKVKKWQKNVQGKMSLLCSKYILLMPFGGFVKRNLFSAFSNELIFKRF